MKSSQDAGRECSFLAIFNQPNSEDRLRKSIVESMITIVIAGTWCLIAKTPLCQMRISHEAIDMCAVFVQSRDQEEPGTSTTHL